MLINWVPTSNKVKIVATGSKVFIRTKSGFVRTMGIGDALVFNMICVGFFTASLYSFQLSPFVFPGADIGVAFLLSIVFATPLYLVWASMGCSMPRTGGDYIYQSRLTMPVLGFFASLMFTVIIQYWYDASFDVMITMQSISPLLVSAAFRTGNMGLMNIGSWFATQTGLLTSSVIIMAIAVFCASPGMPFYVKLQRILFFLTCIGVAALFYVLLTADQTLFIQKFNQLMLAATGEKTDWYNLVITTARDTGYVHTPINLYDTLGAVPVTLMCMGYGFWTIFVFSEVKSASNFKYAVFQMEGALIIMGLMFFGLANLLVQVSGREFYNSLFYLYMMADPLTFKIPIIPNYMFIAYVVSPNLWFDVAIAVGTAAAAFCLVVQIVIVISRVIMAMTFDRLFPEKLGYVGTRFVSPVYINIATFFINVGFIALAIWYPTIVFYFGVIAFAAVPAYALDAISAILFPRRMKSAYEASPVSKYKIGGIPLTMIVGVLTLIFAAYIAYFYLTVPGLGFLYPPGYGFFFAPIIGAIVYFYVMRWYRRKYQGIDIDLAFRLIPPE